MLDETDRRILTACAEGRSLAAVAAELEMSRDAVGRRLQQLREAWSKPNTVAVVVHAIRLGAID